LDIFSSKINQSKAAPNGMKRKSITAILIYIINTICKSRKNRRMMLSKYDFKKIVQKLINKYENFKYIYKCKEILI
jgi:hypothetical protein